MSSELLLLTNTIDPWKGVVSGYKPNQKGTVTWNEKISAVPQFLSKKHDWVINVLAKKGEKNPPSVAVH